MDEIYGIFVAKGTETVIYIGIHENICVQGKAEGMTNMYKLGFEFILAR